MNMKTIIGVTIGVAVAGVAVIAGICFAQTLLIEAETENDG